MSTQNLQVAASADDGSVVGTNFSPAGGLAVGNNGGLVANSWLRFTGVSELAGATIASATLSVKGVAQFGSPDTLIYAEDAESPAAPTNTADYNSRTPTTESVAALAIAADEWNDFDVTSIIQELADSYDPSTIQILWKDNGGGSGNFATLRSYDNAPADAATLTIVVGTARLTARAAAHGCAYASARALTNQMS